MAARVPIAGLLPFYIKLYDDKMPQRRAGYEGFLERLAASLEARGLAVKTAPVCRTAPEFHAAIGQLERADADCLVTVHLAYSPSLESLDAVCGTPLPVVILDTTMDAGFGPGVSPERVMFNHGVHGVMDFACMLRRRGRPFEIVAGHADDATMLDRAAELVRAAAATGRMRKSSVLRVGPAFEGMGDFAVAEDVLASRLGVRTRQAGLDELDQAVRNVSDDDVRREVAVDRERFACGLLEEVHARSVRVGLGLRRLLAEGGHTAMSVNFQAFDRSDRPANTMPFLEISKAMAGGIGYAGEGDVLTAAMVGALSSVFDAVTFTEVFCPDWSGGSLFLSHMGEINPAVSLGRPRVIERPFPFGDALRPAVLTCAVRPGPGVFVNLAPAPDDGFSLIVAPVEVLGEDGILPAMRDMVRCWVRPRRAVADFLEAYSRAGGTHHSALVLGDQTRTVAAFGRMLALDVVVVD
jgi:L-arabinose isomerase